MVKKNEKSWFMIIYYVLIYYFKYLNQYSVYYVFIIK